MPQNRSRHSEASFTLIEVLVALAIFSILSVILLVLVSNATVVVTRDNDKMASLSDARQALNRFSIDWYSRVRRSDVNWIVTNSESTNANLTMLCQVTAPNGSRGLSSVSYCINPATGYGLQRGALGYNWTNSSSGGANPTLTFSNTGTSIQPSSPPTANFETLAPTVLRVCFSYLDTNSGQWTNIPAGSNWISLNATNLGAVAITVASLDIPDQAILTPGQITSLAGALGDATNDPYAQWLQKVNTPGFAASVGVPVRAASAVRIYHKVLYVGE